MNMSKKSPINEQKKESHLKLLRKEKGLTQAQLANILNLDIKTYREYEKGKQLPKSDILINMSDYFKVSTDYILNRSNCRSVDNDYIHDILGIDDNSINTLASWNEYEKRMLNSKTPLHYQSIKMLNELFKDSFDFEMLLRSIQDLFNSQYRYPVYHTGKNEIIKSQNGDNVLVSQAICPCNEIDNINGELPLLNLAKNRNEPWDYYSVVLDDTFFETVAIKAIEKSLYEIKNRLYKNNK